MTVDLRAVLTFIAEHEPLDATGRAFPKVSQAQLRHALRTLAHSKVLESTAENIPPTSTDVSAIKRDAHVAASKKLIVYSDGASRGNPGAAGAGWVICDSNERQLATGGIYLGKRTNNEAEYAAAAMGLKAAAQMGGGEVVLRADSELMVRQLQGRYQVRNERLLPLFREVQALIRQFDRFTAQHVPRAQNAAADEQANLAIDEARNRR